MRSRPPLEMIFVYSLLGLIGLVVADLAILHFRDQMLPINPPLPKRTALRSNRFADRGAYNIITSRNIFNSDGKIPNPIGTSDGKKEHQEGPPVPSQLPLQLLGTIVHVNPSRSVATIHLRNKNDQLPFRLGEVIPENLATVTKIERAKVIFRNTATQKLEYIDIKDEAKIGFGLASGAAAIKQNGEVLQKSETEFELKRGDINKLTGNLPELLQQARAVPNIGPNGQQNGFRIMDIQPGSIYERLGIKRGDVIQGVNGEAVDSPAKAMELYNALRNSPSITLQVERDGRHETRSYNITD